MRALIQRVTTASVTVNDEVIGKIDQGLLILICAMSGDSDQQADKLAAKIAKLRIFAEPTGKMNLSVRDIGGSALVVSQFTLAADTSRGNRPGFSAAAPPDEGARLYNYFIAQLTAQGLPVQTGRFGADMAVALTNDGPVTIWIES
jgi:D-tyrosyl-tRNA(Tyr) deacylase